MFKTRFTRIKEISEVRRLPRLGKIRLGVKVVSRKTGKEHPKEVEYFVVPPEVARVYGDRPTFLDVMVPINDPEVVFPQAYKWYGGQRGLKCIGNGEVAVRLNEETKEMCEISCPCEKLNGECQRVANLMVILPKINMGGVYQIDIGSYHSIVDINSGLDYVQALVGRFAMVPLRLCRVPKETHHNGQKQVHYTLQLFLDADVDLLNNLRENTQRVLLSTGNLALPAPEPEPMNGSSSVVIELEEESEEEEEEWEEESAKKLNNSSTNKTNGNLPPKEGGENGGKIAPLQQIAIERLAGKKGLNYSEKVLKTLSFKSAQRLISALQQNTIDPVELQKEFPGVIL